jgi:hypothetical protein
MQKSFQFSISLLFLVSYGAAICLAKDLGFWTVLFLLQPLLIWIVVSVLQQGIPRRIVEASQENVYRLDGSKSSRRESREQRKWKEVRFALYAISIAATFSIDWLIVLLNSDLILAAWRSNWKPLVILGCVAWLLLTYWFIQHAYLRILSDFYRGIRSRKNDYVAGDVGRLQP